MRISPTSEAWPKDAEFAPAGEWLRFRAYGLAISSQIRLALPEDAAQNEEPCVRVEVGTPDFFSERRAEIELAPDDGWWYRHGFAGDGSVYLFWEDLFQFWISAGGGQIVCGSIGAETMESFQVYLLGHALGFALVNQGQEPLHATVVRFNGRTVAFLGPCGAGKSTLASYLLRCGGQLVTDDLLRLDVDGERVLAHPGPQRIKLLPEPAGLYMSEKAHGVPMNPTTGKLIIPLRDPHRAESPVPVDALIQLDWPENDEVRMERLHGREAFLSIIAGTFNRRVTTPARLARQFRFAEAVCARLPVYRLRYPRDFELLPRLRDMIWAEVDR